MLYNKKLTMQYIGTEFAGWQVQTNGRTVQEEIQNALTRMYKRKITIIGSGRTDAGVHALGQTASYRTDKYLSPESVHKGLNSMLPPYDISISDVADMPEDFHAQRSAKSKSYQYRIFASKIRSAMYANRTWWVKDELDYKDIGHFLKVFEGEHDFSSFCVQTSLKENNVRRVNSTKCFMDGGDVIYIEINGNGFLHNMVRIMVGTVVNAIRKGYDMDYMINALQSKDRNQAGPPTANAMGLYLKEVFFIN